MRTLIAILLVAAAMPSAGQEPRTIAVLSMIGDSLTILRNEERIGSNLDRSRRSRLDLDTATLDHSTLLAASREIKKVEPATKTVLLGARSKELFAAQSRSLDDNAGITRLLDMVRPFVSPANATHLMLVTKHRSDARTRLANSVVGDGMIEGLGFYVDPNMDLVIRETGERFVGFFSPFTYFLVSLVDLKDGKVLAQHPVTSSRVVGTGKSETAWQALTAGEKVKMLQDMVGQGLAEAVPRVLGR
jgi:hypothetical protein